MKERVSFAQTSAFKGPQRRTLSACPRGGGRRRRPAAPSACVCGATLDWRSRHPRHLHQNDRASASPRWAPPGGTDRDRPWFRPRMDLRRHRLEPFDASLLVCVVAVAVFGLLVAVLTGTESMHRAYLVWPLFLALSAVGWATIDTWAPTDAPALRMAPALLGFVTIEALAVAPLVDTAWDVGGPRSVLGAGIATGVLFAGLVTRALLKPTTELQVVDLLVAPGLVMAATFFAAVAVGLPLRLAPMSGLIGLSGLFALREISSVFSYVGAGQAWAGGARLFACVTLLFAELVVHFGTAVHGDAFFETLWASLGA